MPDTPRIKFCGLTRPGDIDAALLAGASYVGFVFFPKSPRNVDPETAASLAGLVPADVKKVALTVNASDEALAALLETVPIDVLQLHGKETPSRVADIRLRFGLPVMKAVGVATADDLGKISEFGEVVDMLLIDAKPPPDAALPGGNGLAFDWRLIAGREWPVPWMLAGGLTEKNVAEAIRLTGTMEVDVSSGVESAPGLKDPIKMMAFAAAARGAVTAGFGSN